MSDEAPNANTYFSRALADEAAAQSGRFAQRPARVNGSEPTVQPVAAPTWSKDPMVDEPPLGFDVNALPDMTTASGEPPRMTDAELVAGVRKLAKLTGIPIETICWMARMDVQSEYDPLSPADLGEPFAFAAEKLIVFDDDDFAFINPEVPKPNARVDLVIAAEECARDSRAIAAFYNSGRDLTFLQHWRLFVCTYDWLRFWSVRDTDAERRATFAELVERADVTGRSVVEWAEAQLRRRAVVLNCDDVEKSLTNRALDDQAERIADIEARRTLRIVKEDE